MASYKMKRRLIKTHAWLAKVFASRRIRLATDVIILLASCYLMVKRTLDFSISDWLLENALQQPLVDAYVIGAGISLIMAILSKLVVLVLDYFPPLNHDFIEPDEISNCLFRMNSEIADHIAKCSQTPPVNIRSLPEQHGCRLNLALITESLAEHIRRSISNIKVKKKDLFISLYAYNDQTANLEYILHYDPKRDLVESRSIDLADKKYEGYECVKCINSTNTTAYVLDGGDYAKGASKRHKTIEHYIGCKLSSENKVFGFLNIEFHNNAIFPDESTMRDFMEEHIFPFKLLLEYQYLKKEFFGSFASFEDNWRVA